MDIRTAFPSKHLKASDFAGDTAVTIKQVQIEEVGTKNEARPIVYFNEASKGLCLNKTNMNTIGDLYGYETDNWIGRMITLYPTETQFEGRMKPCIRVRTAAPQLAPPQPAAPQPATVQPTTVAPQQPPTEPNALADILTKNQQ